MPEIFLVRLVNQCNSTIPFSIHEMKGTIVARNGLLIGQDNRKVYDTINIDPGESCDVLYKAQTAEVDIPAYGWRFKQKQDMIETGQQLTNAMIKELRSLTTKLPSQERLSRWMKYVFDGRPNVCNNALAKLYKINFAGNLKELNKLSKDQEPTGQLVVLETQFDTFKSRLGRTPGVTIQQLQKYVWWNENQEKEAVDLNEFLGFNVQPF